MSAPKGNQFWKLADPACLGRPPIFESPTQLWERAKEYFQECDDNPIETTETTVGKGLTVKTVKHRMPYTWEGFYSFLGVESLDRYRKKKDFVGILAHIKNIIYNQKFSGAAVGIFNSSIIARDLGLKERTDHTTNGEKIGTGLTEQQIMDEVRRLRERDNLKEDSIT